MINYSIAEDGTEENDELEILLMLVEKYENQKVREFLNPDLVEAIKAFHIPAEILTQSYQIVGNKN